MCLSVCLSLFVVITKKFAIEYNRLVFYCRSYCSLNMFRAPLCPSSGARDLYRWLLPMVLGALVYMFTCFGHHYVHHQELEIYTDGCCLWYLALWFTGRWSGVELWVMCPVCGMPRHPGNRTHNPQLHTRPTTCKPKRQVP